MSIPMSNIISMLPGVIAAAGNALNLNGVFLTQSTKVPARTAPYFGSADAVGDYFGYDADEYAAAVAYFTADDNKQAVPGRVYFFHYATASTAASLSSGSLADMTVDKLKEVNGFISVLVDGTEKRVENLDLSAATSFINAAALLSDALKANVSYDTTRKCFVVTSGTTGTKSTLAYAMGAGADTLKLSSGSGAVLAAQGTDADTPNTAMTALGHITQAWATFTTMWEPTKEEKLGFTAWSGAQNNRFLYVAWDTDANAFVANDTSCFGAQIKANKAAGVVALAGEASQLAQLRKVAAFLMGAIASTDYDRTNGRKSLAFKSQSGLAAIVTDASKAATAIANGYNIYGAYATAQDSFNWLYPGTIPGKFNTISAYVNQIWLNAQIQYALAVLISQVNSVPFNTDGDGLIEAAVLDALNTGVNAGVIRKGVSLSESQKQQLFNAIGRDVSSAMEAKGYIFIPGCSTASAAQRTDGIIKPALYYNDGGEVRSISMTSTAVL
ncbi:DUF3383 domain-containing protein [Zymobacter sp. IVIA_12111.31 C1]|uniref:DUF3383 domain-containing protein n=1 Tax=Zymobacter sp. IVIA_12111.31 C1 TaxID=3394854 RepID=UPI0039C2FE58